MNRAFFWGAVFALSAAIAHLAYVLFVPRYEMSAIMARAGASAALNSFAVLDAEAQSDLFPDDTTSELRALCPFSLEDGAVRISAELPDLPWVLAIYSPRGEPFYALGHEQAGVNRIGVTIRREQSLAAIIGGEAPPELTDGWTVESPESRGLAVFWIALSNPLLRNHIAEALAKSDCGGV